jgi:hypothetical protein
MTQLKNAVEPFGEVNVHREANGSIRVWASILMEPRKEGAQTGIAIDGSGSMRKLFGQETGGGVVSAVFAKPKLQNQVAPVAQKLCSYLASTIDADGGTTCIYWAVGPNGTQVELVGDLTADQAATFDFRGPQDFGTGTQLLPAVRYFVDRFSSAPWGFFVFITDGELFDLEEVKQYSVRLAQEVAAGRRRPLKLVLIGMGPDANERQLEELDDLETSTEVDLWDHKMAAEMRQLQEIFAEVVDRNARVADNGKILDPSGRVIKDYSDTGLPAVLRFNVPAGTQFFTLEVNGQRFNQQLTDHQVIAPAAPIPVTPVSPVLQTPPPVVVVKPTAPIPVTPVVQAPPPPPAPVAQKPQNEWDKDPVDIEMDPLAASLDLEFADLGQAKPNDAAIDLEKTDDDEQKK